MSAMKVESAEELVHLLAVACSKSAMLAQSDRITCAGVLEGF